MTGRKRVTEVREGFKRCSRGERCVHPAQVDGGWLPATAGYFGKDMGQSSRLKPPCKLCQRVDRQKAYKANPEKARQKSHLWRESHRDDVRNAKRLRRQSNTEKEREANRRSYADHAEERREGARRWREAHPEKAREASRRYEATHKEERNEKNRRYRATHKEETRQYNFLQYWSHPEEGRARARRWFSEHRDERREYDRLYRETHAEVRRTYRIMHPAMMRAGKLRRRARKLALPSTFTAQDWSRALDYFNGCCAYCGHQRDFWAVLEADHFVPLNAPDCEGTTATNMLPACRSCNRSKSDKAPALWLIERFGKRQAAHIMKRIETYFRSLDA